MSSRAAVALARPFSTRGNDFFFFSRYCTQQVLIDLIVELLGLIIKPLDNQTEQHCAQQPLRARDILEWEQGC
jgi:hypothetical protein